MFRDLRRKDREIGYTEVIEILKSCGYGVLSTVSEDGYAYGVPLNYVYADNSIYFHSAEQGHKLDNIVNQNKVSFCVVGKNYVLPDKFTTNYESVIIFGRAEEIFDDEKNAAMLKMLEKYSKEYVEKGREYLEKANSKVKVIKINIEHISGKARR